MGVWEIGTEHINQDGQLHIHLHDVFTHIRGSRLPALCDGARAWIIVSDYRYPHHCNYVRVITAKKEQVKIECPGGELTEVVLAQVMLVAGA